jgi:hypothetical protein
MKKLALVGMNNRTCRNAPFDDPDFEIWTLNEAYVNKWMKRYDVLFQLHPRWDWERGNNFADPNHPRYIKAESGDCLFCSGTSEAMKEGKAEPCPWCEDGKYKVPEHRKGKRIYMQNQNDDVPGCLNFPAEHMTVTYCQDEKPYFTSTLAHMLICAIDKNLRGSQRKNKIPFFPIYLYGFEMESDTEYIHQRPCAEYWIGYGRALGIKIEAPGANILTGAHYAYESNVQGYRTRLELRMQHLRGQMQKAEAAALMSEGALNAVTPFKQIPEVTPAFDLHFDEHFRRKGFVSFIRGAIRETENLIKMYDAYNVDGNEKPSDAAQLLQLTYELG